MSGKTLGEAIENVRLSLWPNTFVLTFIGRGAEEQRSRGEKEILVCHFLKCP